MDNTLIEETFNALHPVVQNVLTSADLGEKLKHLSKKYALHLDKWALLENEITLTLLGVTDPENIVSNIESHVGVPHDVAVSLANDAADLIFNPTRDALEHALRAGEGNTDGIPVEQKMIMEELGGTPPPAPPSAATGETPGGDIAKVVAARLSDAETAKTAPTPVPKETLPKNPAADSSHMRKTISSDPYREQV